MSILYVLERKSRAGITSPALDTFVMSGFFTSKSCLELINSIYTPDSRTRISTLDEYLMQNKVPRFHDDTGKAAVIQKVGDAYEQFTLSPLMAYLITHKVTVINVIEGHDGINQEFIYLPHEMDTVRATNELVKRVLMLEKDYRGSFIYRTQSGLYSGLDQFIVAQKEMCDDIRFIVVYQNPTISTIVDIENRLFANDHRSIVISKDEILYEIGIMDARLILTLIDTQQTRLTFK